MSSQFLLWIRWSWRDLRQRWMLVGAIALVIALGTGTYAGLLGTSEWRRQSNDASFALLRTHDLRVGLAQGGLAPEGRLQSVAAGIPHARDVTAVRERLVVPTQLAGRDGHLLVTGQLVGTATGPDPTVDGVSVDRGRGLTAADDGAPVAVVETTFARKNHLPPGTELTVSGGGRLTAVGRGQSPEYFVLTGQQQGGAPFLDQRSFGVLFSSLHTAQGAAGLPRQVNDLVLTLRAGADRDQVRRELEQAFAATRPSIAATVTTRDDIDAYRILYRDIDGDAQMWRMVALLILLGAAFAALNLTGRIVEAQRREIGIGMALGVPARLLAVRPLLFGMQVALLGTVLGLVVGWGVSIPLRTLFTGVLPLPVWHTPLQGGTFAQAAALGFVLPLVAVAWPIWRALRVQPVEAIRVGHLAARGSGLVPLLRRLPVPGRGYRQMPVRNVLRTPRRTALTALGIAAATTTFVATMGFLDTFVGSVDRTEDELLHSSPDRVAVSLDTFQPADGETLRSVRALPSVADVTSGLVLSGTARAGRHDVDLMLEVLPDAAPWRPTLLRGSATGGLVLAEKAARDLGVGVGDLVNLEHPQATDTGFRTVHTQLRVAGIHPNPMRVFAYLDQSSAAAFRLTGNTNLLTVLPRNGVSGNEVRRALLGVPHVASVQPARATTDSLRSALDQYLGVLEVAALVTLLLVLLIAFNSTSIGVDERAREHATMLAFGLPVRTVLGLTTLETVLVGALGALVGVLGGYAALAWLVNETVPRVMPEIGFTPSLSGTTITVTILLSILTVAVAPLFTLRRMRRMDIPATLRVMD